MRERGLVAQENKGTWMPSPSTSCPREDCAVAACSINAVSQHLGQRTNWSRELWKVGRAPGDGVEPQNNWGHASRTTQFPERHLKEENGD